MAEGSATQLRSPFEYMAGNRIAVAFATLALLALGLFALVKHDRRTVPGGRPAQDHDHGTLRRGDAAGSRRGRPAARRGEPCVARRCRAHHRQRVGRQGRGDRRTRAVAGHGRQARCGENGDRGDRGLPPTPGADEPEIVRHEILRGVLSLVLTSATASEDRLTLVADQLRAQLLHLPRVDVVDLYGARERQIQVDLDETRLRSHRLSVAEVIARIRGSSINLSGGEVRTETGTLVMSVLQKRNTGPRVRRHRDPEQARPARSCAWATSASSGTRSWTTR